MSDKMEIIIDAKTGKAVSNVNKLDKSLSGMAKTAVTTIASLYALKKSIDFSKELSNVARDAEETASKFKTVFSSIENDAQSVRKAFQDEFKLARKTTEELLSSTGDLLVGFGFAEKEALKLSANVNALAQDLASFQNYSGGAKGASEALTKALLGETESAKSLGIVIRQNTKEFKEQISEQMKSKGITEQQAKAYVIFEEAVKQSGKAIGDFERTMGSVANQEKMIAEQWIEVQTVLGKSINIALADELPKILKMLEDTRKELETEGSLANVSMDTSVKALKLLGLVVETVAKSFVQVGISAGYTFAQLKDYFVNTVNLSKETGEAIWKSLKAPFEAISNINLVDIFDNLVSGDISGIGDIFADAFTDAFDGIDKEFEDIKKVADDFSIDWQKNAEDNAKATAKLWKGVEDGQGSMKDTEDAAKDLKAALNDILSGSGNFNIKIDTAFDDITDEELDIPANIIPTNLSELEQKFTDLKDIKLKFDISGVESWKNLQEMGLDVTDQLNSAWDDFYSGLSEKQLANADFMQYYNSIRLEQENALFETKLQNLESLTVSEEEYNEKKNQLTDEYLEKIKKTFGEQSAEYAKALNKQKVSNDKTASAIESRWQAAGSLMSNVFSKAFGGQFDDIKGMFVDMLKQMAADLASSVVVSILSGGTGGGMGMFSPSGLLGGLGLFKDGGEVKLAAGGSPKDMRSGGLSLGAGTNTSDDILAYLSNEEFVLKASSAKKLGSETLNYMNEKGELPGFAEGGNIKLTPDKDTIIYKGVTTSDRAITDAARDKPIAIRKLVDMTLKSNVTGALVKKSGRTQNIFMPLLDDIYEKRQAQLLAIRERQEMQKEIENTYKSYPQFSGGGKIDINPIVRGLGTIAENTRQQPPSREPTRTRANSNQRDFVENFDTVQQKMTRGGY